MEDWGSGSGSDWAAGSSGGGSGSCEGGSMGYMEGEEEEVRDSAAPTVPPFPPPRRALSPPASGLPHRVAGHGRRFL